MRVVRAFLSVECKRNPLTNGAVANAGLTVSLRGVSSTALLRSKNQSNSPSDPTTTKVNSPSDAAGHPSSAVEESSAKQNSSSQSGSTSRGASFAKRLRPDSNSGPASPIDGPANLYAHTIVTAADKAPTGVAVPAATSASASSTVSGTAPRKRYSTVPLRSSHSGSGPGGAATESSAFAPNNGENATSEGKMNGASRSGHDGATSSFVSFSAGDGTQHASSTPMSDSGSHARSGSVAVQKQQDGSGKEIKTAARPQDGPMVPDYGPLRATGLWSVDEVLDEAKKTVDFRRIDDVESDIVEELKNPEEALVPYEEEEKWKHKLMFECKFKKTPKHLTWKELGEEIECMDCVIEPDEHRPEEIFTITFFFTDKKTGTRDTVWTAKNDVSYSEGFTDLLAAVGACLGRSDVHRTIRFDDGVGCTRDVTFRKRSRYTSDVYVAFRPPEKYNKFERKEEKDEYEAAMEKDGMSTWGYHPSLMDPEFSELDFQDPEGTYEVAISAHGFSYIILRAVNRLLARPMKDFYRPSQLMRTAKVKTEDEIGFMHAMKGWMGVDEQLYPHFTPIEALQDHWLGKDAPFSLCSIVNKIREMNYLKKENPEFQSWLSVRNRDTHLAIRNMGVKLLGVGASTLFVPVQHNATVNRLLPKSQQRRLESKFSLNAVLGLPDETRKLEEFKQITGFDRITDAPTTSPGTSAEENVPKTRTTSTEK